MRVKLIAVVIITTFCQNVISQWINIGNQGTSVYMTSNTLGFKSTSSTGEVGYVNYKLIRTETDWVYEDDLINYESNIQGCCTIDGINFFNDLDGMMVLNSQYNLFFLLTSDGGETWQQTDTLLRFNPLHILSQNDTLGYLSYMDNDNSGNFQFFNLMGGHLNFLYENDSLDLGGDNIEFINPDTGFVVLNNTTHSFLFKTENGGNHWVSPFYSPNFYIRSISFGTDSTGVIVGNGGKIFKSIDYGENWTEILSPTTTQINSVDFYNDTVGFIVCNQGEIYKTLDGGNSWINESIAGASNLLNVKIVDIKHAYAYDSSGILYKQGSVLGVTENKEKTVDIKVYPNPANVLLNIECDDSIEKVTIYNSIGQEIFQSSDKTLDISTLISGIYTLVVELENKVYQQKFIKS